MLLAAFICLLCFRVFPLLHLSFFIFCGAHCIQSFCPHSAYEWSVLVRDVVESLYFCLWGFQTTQLEIRDTPSLANEAQNDLLRGVFSLKTQQPLWRGAGSHPGSVHRVWACKQTHRRTARKLLIAPGQRAFGYQLRAGSRVNSQTICSYVDDRLLGLCHIWDDAICDDEEHKVLRAVLHWSCIPVQKTHKDHWQLFLCCHPLVCLPSWFITRAY